MFALLSRCVMCMALCVCGVPLAGCKLLLYVVRCLPLVASRLMCVVCCLLVSVCLMSCFVVCGLCLVFGV